MSTKTSIKRIALVAVSALGLGMVTSTTPANAAAATNAEVTAVISTAATANTYAVGQAQTFTATVTTADVDATDNVDIKAMITSAPVTSTFSIDATNATDILGASVNPGNQSVSSNVATIVSTAHGLTTGDKIKTSGHTTVAYLNVASATITRVDANTFTYAATGADAGAADDAAFVYQVINTSAATDAARGVLSTTAYVSKLADATHTFGTFAFTPTAAGSYTLTLWHDQNGDNVISASEVTGASTFMVTASGLGTTEAGAGSGESATAALVANTDVVGNDVLVSKVALALTNVPRVGQQTSVTPTATFYNNRSTGGNHNMVTAKRVATLNYSLSKPAGSASALSSSSAVIAADGAAVAKDATDDTAGTAITFTPDVAGTYTVTAWHDANGNGLQDNLEALGTKAVAVFADALDLTIKAFNTTADLGNNEDGALIRVQLTNGGAKASLAANESVKITVSGATGSQIESVKTATSSTAVDATTYTMSSGQFDADGYAWINVSASAAGTTVVAFEGQGGTATSINKTQSITFADATATIAAGASTLSNTTGVRTGTAYNEGTANGSYFVNQLKSTSVGVKVASATASGKVRMQLTDVSGRITGLANAAYASYVTADATASTVFTVALPAIGYAANIDTVVGNSFTVDLGTAGGQNITVTTEDAVAGSVTMDQSDAVRVKNGSSVTVSGIVKDQFLVAMPNVAVTISHTAGDRNATVAVTNAVSDSSGRVTKTWTDAPLTGVTATTDSIVFNPAGNDYAGATNNKTVVITYVASLGVKTVIAYGGNTDSTGATATTVSWNDIKAGGSLTGAEAGAQTLTAKVTDASGSVLVGVPVTWSVVGEGVEIASNALTTYTNSSGLATTSIYAWTKGTYTYTATADAVSGTGTISFAQIAAGEERSISVTTTGSLVTAKVVDRFGNPVPLVKVWATRTGSGYFGSGLTKTSGDTDTNGEVSFTIAGGAATVTVATYDISDVTAKGSGQSCARKGALTCADAAADDTLLAAYVAGTTTKAAVGVGASLDAAGVSSATVDVAVSAQEDAIDAANEATDAANAATDAANAAAEAADAATAAAQDAQAAVAALATEVAAMISGIKAQIIRLTNLVVKIQKKVKA